METDLNERSMKSPVMGKAALDPPARTLPSRPSPLHRPYGVALLAGASIAAVLWLLAIWHATWLWPGQSDSAAVVLLGRDMASGNWTLAGWLLPLDTYWLAEV